MRRNVLFALGLLALAPSAMGDVLVESYTAFLSKRDHHNSSGDRLDNVAAIIRQDRANYHKYGRRDDADQGDSFFASASNREILERMLNRGRTTRAVKDSIVHGYPMITVNIFRSESGENYINVLVSE